VFRIGKIIADDNSKQVALATKAGIFEVEEASKRSGPVDRIKLSLIKSLGKNWRKTAEGQRGL
jgi:hypothetical protein